MKLGCKMKMLSVLICISTSVSLGNTALTALRLLTKQTLELSKKINQAELAQKIKQHLIIQNLRTLKPTSTFIYHEITPALLEGNTFPLLKNNMTTVSVALQLFSGTPGFQGTLNRFFMNLDYMPFASGFLYELEKAVQIMKYDTPPSHDAEYIIAFNARKQSHVEKTMVRIIDIETNKRWIECKNIGWFYAPSCQASSRSFKLQQQFLEQKKLVDEFNELLEKSIAYEVHSKQPIPEKWKIWFSQHDINYKEEK